MIKYTEDFPGWNEWKTRFKQGLDCEVKISLKDNRITVSTQNLGVVLKSVTTIRDMPDKLYVALSGDQVALTDIHIK